MRQISRVFVLAAAALGAAACGGGTPQPTPSQPGAQADSMPEYAAKAMDVMAPDVL